MPKNAVFIRNFTIFVFVVLGCIGLLSIWMVSGQNGLDETDDWVIHTYEVIGKSQKIISETRGMLADQRGYLLTGEERFLDAYEVRKKKAFDTIAALKELTQDNPKQQSRLSEIQAYILEFSIKLEERAANIDPDVLKVLLTDNSVINNLRENIDQTNNIFLEEEYSLLNSRIKAVEYKRDQYFGTLIVGTIVGGILLLLFNAFLLRAQLKRGQAERTLETTEDRLRLAIEGTQDGVFDWNLETEEVFYSARYFQMLGYDKGATTEPVETFKDLLHPDDKERVWSYVERYVAGDLSEFSIEFRLKHETGRWLWIQSKAKALFNAKGEAIRVVGAHADITHIKKAQEKLEAEKAEAEESNRAKSDFLAHMSHEIRTPLTAISGIAEIFQKDKSGFDKKQAKLVDTLANSSRNLKDLINDILDFSKIESQEIDLNQDSFALDAVFEEMVSMMAVRANEKGISFVCDHAAVKDKDFFGDELRLRQIIINLIGNAIKFTDEGGVTTTVGFEDRDGHDFLRVDVSDTGVGISADDFDLVFERFKQADSSESRRFGGTGLGLPISRNLARLMGGEIFISSQVGKGSTFSLILPAKVSESQGEETPQKKENLKKINDKISRAVRGESKVLIVEDYEGNIVVLSHMLDEIGLEHDIARNGVEAVQLWNDNYYDLVLMDVQMPEMDGFEATKAIRSAEAVDGKDERTPIIGMTAHALVGDKDKCIAAGMDAYLPKPIVEADLKKEMLKFLTKQKQAA